MGDKANYQEEFVSNIAIYGFLSMASFRNNFKPESLNKTRGVFQLRLNEKLVILKAFGSQQF